MSECPDCGGRLIDFYNRNDRRVSDCPEVCTACDTLWAKGERYKLPQDWGEKFPSVVKEARRIASDQVDQAKGDKDFRARVYFERVFYWAFSEGFLRAFAYFKHKYKDGRFRRVRALWDKIEMKVYGSKCVISGLTKEEYDELTTLINLGRKSSKKQNNTQD